MHTGHSLTIDPLWSHLTFKCIVVFIEYVATSTMKKSKYSDNLNRNVTGLLPKLFALYFRFHCTLKVWSNVKGVANTWRVCVCVCVYA